MTDMEDAMAKVECPVDGASVELGTDCQKCGVYAGEPCVTCGEAMYHRAECSMLDAPGFEDAPYVDRGR